MPNILWVLKDIGTRVLYAWIIIGWMLIIPAFVYFFSGGGTR